VPVRVEEPQRLTGSSTFPDRRGEPTLNRKKPGGVPAGAAKGPQEKGVNSLYRKRALRKKIALGTERGDGKGAE